MVRYSGRPLVLSARRSYSEVGCIEGCGQNSPRTGLMKILGIETSCDETAAAVFDTSTQRLLSHHIYSQIALHENYGGIVPEIASRSQLEKINGIVQTTLDAAHVSINDIDVIAVTGKPGLVGSLLVGTCFAKGLAWSLKKKIIGVDHLEGHIFSSWLKHDGTVHNTLPFPYLCLSVSGGHTALYQVHDFGTFEMVGQTLDDAAGEAFDKIAKILGFGYPGGAIIERLAQEVDFKDFFHYPRSKLHHDRLQFSFSGLKTAVLYDLVKRGAYDLATGPIPGKITLELQQQVASSLLIAIADIFCDHAAVAFKRYPETHALTFVGGVACNKYLRMRLEAVCHLHNKVFFVTQPQFCTDNAAMIAFVGSYKAAQNKFSDFSLDVLK